MTLHEEQERVQKAVRNSLAYVQEDPWLTQRVLAKAKGEEPVKKKISLALVLCIILALALMGTAFALFSSKTAEFFGEQFGDDLADWLRGGKVAQVNETDILNSVEFTLDEVVYRERHLYGVGTARVKDPKDVLLTDAMASSIGEISDPETLELLDKAKNAGGRALSVYCWLREIGIDGGEMVTASDVGADDELNEDGSITFSFESSGYALAEGETYRLKFSIGVEEWTAEGAAERRHTSPHYWTVECAPVLMEDKPEKEETGKEQTAEPPAAAEETAIPEEMPAAAEETAIPEETPVAAEETAIPEETPATAEELPAAMADPVREPLPAEGNEAEKTEESMPAVMHRGELHADGYELLVPEEYRNTGTLPVYQAIKSDLTATVQPEWFNRSGILEQRDKTIMSFNDHAELTFWPETLHYEEYTDELFDYSGPDTEPMLLPKEALSQGIEKLASAVFGNIIFERGKEYLSDQELEHLQLPLLSLEDAKHEAEELFERLGLNGYELAYALDMSLERIRTLGEAYEKEDAISGLYDFASATEEDAGYFLYYTPLGITKLSDGRQQIELFVNSRGIALIRIANHYNRGEAVDTPALISPEEAVELMHKYSGKAKQKFEVKSIQRVALSYIAVRAEDKKQGTVFTPAWQIWFNNGGRRNNCWVDINAVNGELIDSNFD